MQAAEEYRNQTASFDGPTPLNAGTGFALIVTFGMFFTAFCFVATNLHLRHNNIKLTSEYFSTAGRRVGMGLTACVIVSSWTWSATILQSSNVTYLYGVSGALWYGAGACIQLFLFGIMSFHLKKYAMNCHTVGEIIYARWGPTAHKVFLYVLLLTNLMVVAMLIDGGSQVFETLTGLDRGSASFFLRLFFYTGSGGLIASFSSAYMHVLFIFTIMVVFVLEVYAASPILGSAEEVYNRVTAVSLQSDSVCIDFGYDPDTQTCGGVAGNMEQSYLTMKSNDGFVFGIINIVGNFGAVFLDQSYWQIAIASHPDACFKGFILGGLLWFAVPFCMSMSLGLSNIALQLPTTVTEASQGLVAAASAYALLDKAGAVALFIQLFMAVSAAGSAEVNAISSILTYDIYRMYINPSANSDQIKSCARLVMLSMGSFMGALSVLVQSLGLPLGWMYLFMGVLVSSGVFPICCCLTWKKASTKAAIAAVLIGQFLAIFLWLFSAYGRFGVISIESTGNGEVMLVGNLVALLSSTVIMVAVTLYDPDDFDLHSLNGMLTLVEEDPHVQDAKSADEIEPFAEPTGTSIDSASSSSASSSPSASESEAPSRPGSTLLTNTISALRSVGRVSTGSRLHAYAGHYAEYALSIALSLLFVIIWPLLSLPAGVFTLGYFKMWVSIVIILSIVSWMTVMILPLYEGRAKLRAIFVGQLFPNLSQASSADKSNIAATGSLIAGDIELSDDTKKEERGDASRKTETPSWT